MTTTAAELAPGAQAPGLTLTTLEGGPAELSSLWRERPLVLAFLSAADTSFCEEQALQLRDSRGLFEQAGGSLAAVVIGEHEEAAAFVQQRSLPYPLFCDPEGEGYRSFGVTTTQPGTFVIDTSGAVRFVYRAASALDMPSTWDVVDAVCALTGAEVERPEVVALPTAAAEALEGALPSQAPRGRIDYACGKCGNQSYELNVLSTAGGWLSRLFNFQYRKFNAVTCSRCGYTELYKGRAGALSNVADILAGG